MTRGAVIQVVIAAVLLAALAPWLFGLLSGTPAPDPPAGTYPRYQSR